MRQSEPGGNGSREMYEVRQRGQAALTPGCVVVRGLIDSVINGFINRFIK